MSIRQDAVQYCKIKIYFCIFLQVKYNKPLANLMNTYAERQKVKVDSIKFRYAGKILGKEITPKQLEMEDGDEIDIFPDQTGGYAGYWS